MCIVKHPLLILTYVFVFIAIDMTANISEALEKVISLGFQRVLTSGGDSSALEGLPVIANLIKQVKKCICKVTLL